MASHQFEVRPVTHYTGARYPSAHADLRTAAPDARTLRRQWSLWQIVVACAMVLGLSSGLMACYAGGKDLTDHNPFIKKASTPSGGDGDAPDHGDEDLILGGAPECSPGEIFCVDDQTLGRCTDAWALEFVDCSEVCREELATATAYSRGCDALAADPCQCEYDIVDGDVAACLPGDVICLDDQTLATCNDQQVFEPTDCAAFCAQMGASRASVCDAGAEDACGCVYDMVDGGLAAWCPPGPVGCIDEATVVVCDGFSEVAESCDDYCARTLGPDATSSGCDTAAPNICGCEPGEDEPEEM